MTVKQCGRVLLAGAAAMLAGAAMSAAPPAAPAVRPLASAPAAAANPDIRVLIAADQESVLAAQMGGRVEALNVQLGSSIRAGQVLLRFGCDEQDAHLNMARAEFYGAQQTYESKAKLQATQSVSMLEVVQAAAEAEKFKAQIQLYQAQLKQCQVIAPFSGRVTRLHVKAFESVNAGQPLIEVVNDRRLKAQLHVPSVWMAWLKTGTSFSMRIDETGKSYTAKVVRMNGKVDPVSQSLEIEAEVLGNVDSLLPGMSGSASFPTTVKR